MNPTSAEAWGRVPWRNKHSPPSISHSRGAARGLRFPVPRSAADLRSWCPAAAAIDFGLLDPAPQSLGVNTQLTAHPGQLTPAFPVPLRISKTIFTARSRSSSGYFRCAGMTLHPSRDQSLQDPRGGPKPLLPRCMPRMRSGSSIRSASRSQATWPVCSRRRNRPSVSSARRSSTEIRLPCPGVRRRG